ncbi:hypothetical protein KI387_024072, partial [Taxus chinensis]
ACPRSPSVYSYGYMYPAWVLTFQHQPQEVMGGGMYGLLLPLPSMGSLPQFYPAGIIPMPYTLLFSSNAASPVEVSSQRAGAVAEDRSHQRHGMLNGDAQRQRREHQRQRILRLIICLQVGLLLTLKLAVAFFIFNRGGSKDRLRLMMFLNIANLVYLYRIGAFAPLLRWLSHGARRAMTPARHPAQTDEVQLNDTIQAAHVDERQDVNWQGLRKEFQMMIVGFVASLFPGFRFSD